MDFSDFGCVQIQVCFRSALDNQTKLLVGHMLTDCAYSAILLLLKVLMTNTKKYYILII